MEYKEALRLDKTIERIRSKLEAGTATHKELSRLASIAGQIAGECMANRLREEFPNGQVSEEDVRRIISPILKQNHKFVTEMSTIFQNNRYKKAGIGFKSVPPEYNKRREDELVADISRRSFENGLAE